MKKNPSLSNEKSLRPRTYEEAQNEVRLKPSYPEDDQENNKNPNFKSKWDEKKEGKRELEEKNAGFSEKQSGHLSLISKVCK